MTRSKLRFSKLSRRSSWPQTTFLAEDPSGPAQSDVTHNLSCLFENADVNWHSRGISATATTVPSTLEKLIRGIPRRLLRLDLGLDPDGLRLQAPPDSRATLRSRAADRSHANFQNPLLPGAFIVKEHERPPFAGAPTAPAPYAFHRRKTTIPQFGPFWQPLWFRNGKEHGADGWT